MRFRIQVAGLLLYVLCSVSAASSFQGVFSRNIGPGARVLGHTEVLREQGALLRSTRGVLFQAHATFLGADGKPVDVAKLALDYRLSNNGAAVTCVIKASPKTCHALPLSDELNWRLANWVGLGGRRAFTLLRQTTPDFAKLLPAVTADGLVSTEADQDEYVAPVLNTPAILELLRHMDYSWAFAEFDSDADLVSKTNARLGYPAALNAESLRNAADSSYVNTDLDAKFSMTLSAASPLSGLPARYYWTTFDDKKYAYLRAIRHARSNEKFRQAVEGGWMIGPAKEKVHADAIDMFRTVAVFRTFAFGNPEAFMNYMEQISKKHTLVLQ